MVRVRARVTGLAKLRGETKAVEDRLKRGDLNVAAALQFFDVVSAKFDAEGPDWAKLSEYRLERRKTKPEPILDYHGALRKAATSWEDESGNKIEMRRTGSSKAMHWTLSGKKVMNQWGEDVTWEDEDGNPHSAHVPARPFWPMDLEWGATSDRMMEPIDRFLDNWVSGDLGPFDADLSKSKSRKRTR